ncbi:hypothetical protein HAX54_050472, partial [Datura stramonium]|nr:hypothetical protein [Datura stramonium]
MARHGNRHLDQDFQDECFSVMEVVTVHQSSDGPSLGENILAILFKPEGGDDGPSSLRRSITCSVICVAAHKFKILELFLRGSFIHSHSSKLKLQSYW